MKKMGFGLMRLPTLEPMNSSSIDLSKVVPLVDLYLNSGFSYFDTAYYRDAEKSTRGRVSADGLQQRFTPASLACGGLILVQVSSASGCSSSSSWGDASATGSAASAASSAWVMMSTKKSFFLMPRSLR